MTARSATVERTYEVWVRIKGEQRMLHFDASDCHKAITKAQQAGYRVLSANKADEAIAGNRKLYGEFLGNVINVVPPPQTYRSALAMDEIAFRRAERRKNNLILDKKGID